MSKSSSCFPSLKCMKRNRLDSGPKLRSNIRMPTIREFLFNTCTNAGTQTSINDQQRHSMNSLGLSTQTLHKSTIALKSYNPFLPVSTFELQKTTMNRPISPAASVIKSNESFIKTGRGGSRNNTLFMSRDSFDAIFSKVQVDSKKNSEVNSEVLVKQPNVNIKTPFVIDKERMPKIKAITPMRTKLSVGSLKSSLKMRIKPVMHLKKHQDYCSSFNTNELFSSQSQGSEIESQVK